MMGLYRFLLAQTVLLSHFGGLPSESSRVAVYSFYTISGFLIFRVLDTKYMTDAGAGIRAFFINRFLRIFPLFVILDLCACLLAKIFNQGFDNGPGEQRLHVLSYSGIENIWNDMLFFIPHFNFQGILPVISSAGPTMPQVWSVGIEMYCYLFAPLILWFARDNWKKWAAINLCLLAYFIVLLVVPHPVFKFEDAIYKNFFPGLFMFVTGGCIWQLRKRITYKFDGVSSFFIIAFYFWYLFFWSTNLLFGHEITNFKFFCDIILSIPVTMLVVFTSVDGTLKKINDQLGELSYGIYLNQYIIAFIMMLVNAFSARMFNFSTVFGAGYNRLEFGIHAAVFSAIAAYITYILIEKNIEKLRKRVGSSKHFGKENLVLCH